LQNNNAKTTPILRFAQEQALRVKPMLGLRASRAKNKGKISALYSEKYAGFNMLVRMTKKLQKSLGIPSLKNQVNDIAPLFMQEWYMNIFNIKKKWFFLNLETTTFYTIVKPFYFINGSQDFITYFSEIVTEAIKKESSEDYIEKLEINEMHLRNTENKATRRILVDMAYHAEIMDYKNKNMSVFENLNEIPQRLLGYRSPKIAFREELEKIME